MKISKYLLVILLAVLAVENANTQSIDKDDYWQNFIFYGANGLSNFIPDSNSVDLGSNPCGRGVEGRFRKGAATALRAGSFDSAPVDSATPLRFARNDRWGAATALSAVEGTKNPAT
jgi:hypothetical protein